MTTESTDFDSLQILRYLQTLDLTVDFVGVPGIRYLPRRHANYDLSWPSGRGLFLKRADDRDTSSLATLRREAELLAVLGVHAPQLVPKLLRWDQAGRSLVTERVDGENAADELIRLIRLDPEPSPDDWRWVSCLAGKLAQLHSINVSVLGSSRDGSSPPWALDALFPGPQFLRGATSEQLEIVRAAQGSDRLRRSLDSRVLEWPSSCLIHGDLRHSNVMLSKARTSCTLVDLEMWTLGPPEWDFASWLADLVWLWMCYNDFESATAAEFFGARFPPVIRYMANSLVTEYLRQTPTTPSRDFVSQVARLLPLRLLQYALETTAPGGEAWVHLGHLCVSLSADFIDRPAHAMFRLFGLSTSESHADLPITFETL